MPGPDPLLVAVDVALLTIAEGRLSALLIRRKAKPFAGEWALPGGFVLPDESVDDAARRELAEETGTDAGHLEQLKTYGSVGRDPRGRVISVAYLGLLPHLPAPTAGSDAGEARVAPVEDLVAGGGRQSLAFDHDEILADAVERARSKLEYTTLATAFVDEPFTIPDLRRVYEAVWGVALHQANFRRKVLATPGFVVATGGQAATGRGWTDQYAHGPATALQPPLLRPE